MNNPRQPSSLEGAWVEVMKAGDYGDRGAWTPDHLDRLAASYNPRLHPAPVVLGHPAEDAPAYAWVRRLRRAGYSLWAQLEKIDPVFESLLRAGRFAQRSVSLYKNFPLTRGPYLRHLGFLGAAPPAVKGLAPLRLPRQSFGELDAVDLAFDNEIHPEVTMPQEKSRLEGFLDHLRAFFAPDHSSASSTSSASSDFADRLAALEQRLNKLTGAVGEGVIPSPDRPEELRSLSRAQARDTREQEKAQKQIASFVETLRSRGRFPPAFDRLGVADFMHRLAAADTALPGETGLPENNATRSATFSLAGHGFSRAENNPARGAPSEGSRGNPPRVSPPGQAASPSLLAWFQDFLTRLPAVIEFGELASAGEATRRSPGGPRTVRFTEPRRGMTIDPESVELAERAETLAAELQIPYAEALARLREEDRAHNPTA